MPSIDTHVHAYVDGLPLAPGRRYTPARAAPVSDLFAVLDAADVRRALLVQPSFLADGHAYLLACLRAHPDRLRGVVSVRGPDEVLDRCEEWHEAGVRGVRLNLPALPVPDLGAASWRGLARTMTAHGWHLEVHGTGGQWAALRDAVAAWPGPVVLDHLGRADEPAAQRHVVGLAALDHVWVKVSAPYRTPRGRAADTAHRILEATEGHRLLWGSDWPFTGHEGVASYPDLVGWAADVVGPAAAGFDDRARALLGWD